MSEWMQSRTYDAWLECENDTWVRFSEIIAIEVEPSVRTTDYVVMFATAHKRYIYKTLGDRAKARGAASDLLHSLANDWKQSA
jgi:hypothetical protein